ncbi:hypothetical protein ARSEF1564_005055 [Beauveria bassiana]
MPWQMKITLLLVPLSMLLINAARQWQQLSLQRSWPFITGLSQPTNGLLNDYECTHEYSIEFLSFDPVVMYLNNFLRDEEVGHLLALKELDFHQSGVMVNDTKQVFDDDIRSSQSARVPRTDVVAACLEQRVKSILGNVQHAETEPIQIVKYEVGERYRLHVDWFFTPQNETVKSKNETRQWNRLASIFAYLDDDCIGGETHFPELSPISSTMDSRKFRLEGSGKGLYVKPRKGSAILWNNLHANGSGDLRVAHAGLPVSSGRKIGMNIWSKFFLDRQMIGEAH